MAARWHHFNWGNPPEAQIQEALCRITLLIRLPKEESLHAIQTASIKSIYGTNILDIHQVTWEPREVRGLKVRLAYPGYVPLCGVYDGTHEVTVEDVFGNISLNDMTDDTLIEAYTRYAKVDHHERLRDVLFPVVFIVYDRES